jgi:Tc toxin complex TcA C-terminal TcB-binding domain/Neuraminidase-like domain/Salmonella virulence plasmid 28.1kDa A protein
MTDDTARPLQPSKSTARRRTGTPPEAQVARATSKGRRAGTAKRGSAGGAEAARPADPAQLPEVTSGLRAGDQGPGVEHLHRMLGAAGIDIDHKERDDQRFGPATLLALHTLQDRANLSQTTEVDSETLAVLLDLQEHISIDIHEDGEPTPRSTPKRGANRNTGLVTGTLTDQDGAGLAHTRVTLLSVTVRGHTALNHATTNASGAYRIAYKRTSPLNLAVTATDGSGDTIATSATVFPPASEPAHIVIDFTTAPDGAVRQPSQYTQLVAAVATALRRTPLLTLQENSTNHQLTFLANAIGTPFAPVAYLYIANVLAKDNGLSPLTLYGLFAEKTPTGLDAALADLPDAGINAAFTSQVFASVLAQVRATLDAALTLAIGANVLPASYASSQPSELDKIAALQVTNIGASPYIGGKTALNDVLAAGNVTAAVQTAFLTAYAATGGRLRPTWSTLRANKSLPAADLAMLQTTLSASQLLRGNLLLVTDTMQRIGSSQLAAVRDLALLGQSDWEARIAQVDPTASSIAPVLPSETVPERIARFAKSLTQRFASRYPTTAFVGRLAAVTSSSFASKGELVRFLTANPTLSFQRHNIDHFVTTNKLSISAPALTELKTIQRLHRVSPHYTSVEALNTAGHTSAQTIYFTGRDAFITQMSSALGSQSLAQTAYARAHMIYATALMALGRYSLAFNGASGTSVATQPPPADTLANLPDMQALFGSQDYLQCEDCQSIYSPAAYLVDLLQYLSWFAASPLAGWAPPVAKPTAREALLSRRPDIQYVALSCQNTSVVIPYIDLVNEILEQAVAATTVSPPVPPTWVETQGTTAERAAIPQQTQPAVAAAAYNAVNSTVAVYPLILPFDVNFAQTTAYIGALGTTRATLLRLFPNAVPASAVAGATLGLNAGMQNVIVSIDTADPWTRWGFASKNPTPVVDPKTRQTYSPNPADWVAALNKVPVLTNRSGLTLPQLYQLLEVIWVTQGAVTLQAGLTSYAGIQLIDPDTDTMVFSGLTGDVLDRANRFLRLLNASGLQMWELDWALENAAGATLDNTFLEFLAGAIAVHTELSLPFQEVLTFWTSIETRDVTSHLADEDTIIPSTYTEVFLNPALAQWSTLFSPTPNGAQIVYLPPITPTPDQLQPLAAITAALSLDAADISAILTFSGAANALTLPTLTALLCYQRLGSSLALSISDLILWITLTANQAVGPTPGTAPQDTSEFLRRLSVLQSTGLAVHDLDYLLRDESLAQSTLTFTTTQAASVLQAVRDAVAKLVSTSAGTTQLTLTAVSGTVGSPVTVTTAQTHGLATGALVLVTGIAGVTGDVAVPIYSVSVTGATTFTLDGSAAQGSWTGGGSVTTNLAATIETIVVEALVSATGAPAEVVTSVLDVTAALPLGLNTIQQLVSQATIDPAQLFAQFPTLAAAFSQVAKGASLCAALALTPAAFTFLVQNASTFGWLDPSALPLTPTSASPYLAFEKLLRAIKLQQRQPARSPKLLDVLAQWISGPLPDLPTALAGPTLAITAVAAGSPIAVTTAAIHNLVTGQQVSISGVGGVAAANGTWTVTVTGPTTFTLDGSAGAGSYTAGGIGTLPDALCIAAALDASIADVTAVAAQLGATAPSLTPATQSGTLADIGVLTQIADALDVLRRYRISGATLVQLVSMTPDANTSTTAMSVFQARYAQSSWLTAVTPVENALRQNRRDALVAYLLGEYLLGGAPAASAGAPFLTTDDIFDYYLIDPEMCACGQTTRLLQPSLAIQQFVTQCFNNLTINANVDMGDPRWSEWDWRQQFRLWQANREVFVYPENYVLPETLPNASPFFGDLQNTIAQSNCDSDSVEAAYADYLRSLVSVANPRVAAHYIQPNGTPQGATVLWVFARSHGNPPRWWYRTRTVVAPGSGAWSAWQQLNLDIASDQVVPVVWDRRLHLLWPIFHLESERQGTQSVPAAGGGSNPPPQKYWAIEFAMSEFSAQQWQAKQTYDQRMFVIQNDIAGDTFSRPPDAFTFKAAQDNSFNLQLTLYYTLSGDDLGPVTLFSPGMTVPIGWGTLALPDAPLAAAQQQTFLPSSSLVDPSQDPSYASVLPQNNDMFTTALSAPQAYSFCGQDYICGRWYAPTTSTVQLNVLAETVAKAAPASLTLLGTIATPRIVIPQQEPTFDGLDPFFIAEGQSPSGSSNGSAGARGRTYLVQPLFYTPGSRPTELTNLDYVRQWATVFEFQTFYHPYARTFLRELEIGGASQLLSRNLQLNTQQVRGRPTFNFRTIYQPTIAVAKPFPGAAGAPDPGETALDFDPGYGGAYSLYNWETFFFIPWFICNQLLTNKHYTDALTWIKYIFNPTDNSNNPAPQRFWEFLPFYQAQAADWSGQQIQNLLMMLAADTQQGINDPATTNAILAWMADPFDPHKVASTRIMAYGKAIWMQALNVIIALGDSLYAVYTAENVAQAEQWYILADLLLGPKPQALRLPPAQQNPAPTYASLQNLDVFSNTLVNIENVVIAPQPPQSLVNGSWVPSSLPQLPGNGATDTGSTLLFGIPPNGQLLQYWDTVAQRLYNIRNCLNMQGVAQPLPLYAPPINPMELIEEQAQGGGAASATTVAPIYRFETYLQRAIEVTGDVRSYSALVLSALEKQDAETLALLRAGQELTIQTMVLNIKQLQVTEAQDQITVLQDQQQLAKIRYQFYSSQDIMNGWEITALALQGAALISNGVGVVLDMTAGGAALVPNVAVGVSGFGGTPAVKVEYGGQNVASSASKWASVARSIGGILSEAGGMAQTMGAYWHRLDEWHMQASLAQAEITAIADQIAAAHDRLQIAQNEVSIQSTQIANAQAITDFLTYKYTNAQLYNWMLGQLSTVHAQAYQLAFSLAQQAQTAYQYELGRPLDQFVQFSYWDSEHKGLTAGDSLLFDLRRMGAQFIANNTRELELTKHISLALTQPTALVQLLQTGSCSIFLDESLFDADHPGTYFRRLRSVALTVPCVNSPFTGLNATLTLGQSAVRTAPPSAGYQPWTWSNLGPNNDPNLAFSNSVVTIATSTGQGDDGLFDRNPRDERWLPFEGQGAICQLNLQLDPRDNNIDLSTITDVIFDIRYSARAGGDTNAVRAALVPSSPRTILVSVRTAFPSYYYSFFNPSDATATQQTLTLPLTTQVFPYSNLGTPTITDITAIMALETPLSPAEKAALSGMAIQGTFGPATGATQNVTFGPATAPDGGVVAALTTSDVQVAVGTATGAFVLTIPSANIPPTLQAAGTSPATFNDAAIEDIVLLITYEL